MLCPKCHRPLADEDDGVYICCAGESLRWHCTACAKVSEGFAFPYGRCPHCGGQLEVVEGSRADVAAALEGIRIAFEIELGGRAFYQRAAAETDDPDLRRLFGRFALMEGEHMETLSRRYHLDIPEPSPSFRIELAAIFGDVESRPQDPANLFRIAIALEQRAATFFTERAAQSAPGSAEELLYRELAAEEREHADLLMTELARWRADKPGMFASELVPQEVTIDETTPPMNAAALILQGHDEARIALVCGDEQISYGGLRDRVARAAAVWRARGIAPGDRIAIKIADGCDWVAGFLGAMWAGAIAIAVNPRVPDNEWQYILDETGFAAILVDGDETAPSPWHSRLVRRAEWHAEVDAASPAPPLMVAPDTAAFWCHSSGTSGKPKAVIHGHRFARAIEQVSRDGLGLRPDDRLYASSKLFFSYPQTNSLYAGLKIGATVIVDPRWPTAATVVEIVEDKRPTVLFSVPSLYRNMLHEGLAPRIAAAGVRLCVAAGEALPQTLRDEWRRQSGLAIVDGYGASESLVLMMLDRGDGRGFSPSPGCEIVPLTETAPGVPTRLLVKAPTIALGYLDRPQAQAEVFRDGGLSPADLFVRNDQGGWRFAGREDSMVKIHGRWVDLIELEQRLATHSSSILETAAVCVPDADGVDAVALFYVATGSDPAVGESLRAGAQTLPPHQRPRWLHAIEALPRGPTGKLLRRKLQDLHRTLG